VKIDPRDFRISGGKKLRLKRWPTRLKPRYKSAKHYQELLAADAEKLDALQQLLSASAAHAVLLIFQGMDAAGKDGAIGHVLHGVNPEGCEVYSFKVPSAEELQHDFLWRTARRLPARGRIGVFNRSHYEEVTVVRVHPELLTAEGVTPQRSSQKQFWRERYHSIVEWEKHLHRNGTQVVKFFLHLSKAEQRKRFLARIDEPDKNWKFSHADTAERKFWSQYQTAYEECLRATSTKTAPWHVVPADDKYNARLIIARIVIAALQRLDLSYPKVTRSRRSELRAIRRQLSQG
jgi:PPK2 family polyphosphate:nucleotide phosphotransferase